MSTRTETLKEYLKALQQRDFVSFGNLCSAQEIEGWPIYHLTVAALAVAVHDNYKPSGALDEFITLASSTSEIFGPNVAIPRLMAEGMLRAVSGDPDLVAGLPKSLQTVWASALIAMIFEENSPEVSDDFGNLITKAESTFEESSSLAK